MYERNFFGISFISVNVQPGYLSTANCKANPNLL